jgi:hypothetical protein
LLIWCWDTGSGGDLASGSTRCAHFHPYFMAAAAFSPESSDGKLALVCST